MCGVFQIAAGPVVYGNRIDSTYPATPSVIVPIRIIALKG